MIPYWFLFGLCALFGFIEQGPNADRRPAPIPLAAVGTLLILMIGLRYEVGGDWRVYDEMLFRTAYMTLGHALSQGDPGYHLVNWLASRLGLGIWGVNLFCGVAFTAGLIAFSRTLPLPWLAILVAVPYLIIVVAMGYSRQGVAIGFGMLGLAALQRGSVARFVVWVAVAAAFHKTAVVLLPFALLMSPRNRLVTVVALALMGAALYFVFLDGALDQLVSVYLEQEYDSQGALIRVLMNVVPATIFLVMQRRFMLPPPLLRLWRNFAIAALACLPALFLLNSTTVVDRIALYLIPLQLFVLGSLPKAWSREGQSHRPIQFAITLYSAAILFVWLNYATHAVYWLPYQAFPFVEEDNVSEPPEL